MKRKKKPGMKKLCVFYEGRNPWVGKKIQWIVCQECQRNIQNGFCFEATLSDTIRIDR